MAHSGCDLVRVQERSDRHHFSPNGYSDRRVSSKRTDHPDLADNVRTELIELLGRNPVLNVHSGATSHLRLE